MKLKKSILAWVMAAALIFFNVPITTVSAADNNLTIQVGETTTFVEGTNIKASKSLPSQQYYYLAEDYNSVAQYNEIRGNSYDGYVLPTYAQLSNEYKAALEASGYIVPDSGMITWVVERKENRTVAEETIGMDGPETYYRDFPVYKIYPLISYDITIDSNVKNGIIVADTNKATRGTAVTLNIKPNDGYEFESISVKDAKNNNLTISGTESTRTFTMPAYKVQVSGTFSKIPSTVETVTVAPMAITMHKGDTENFTASVSGTYGPSTDVIWTVEGASSSNTTISSSGELKVGSDETALNLTVKATSVQDATKSAVASVAVIRANIIQSAASNKITGIKEGASYILGTDMTFDATGSSMDNTSPISGDIRYIPVNWSVNPNGTWTSTPYTATFKINNEGKYTLKVVYQKQNYDGTSWVNIAGDTDTKTVSFTVEKPASIDSVAISPVSITVQKGETQIFTATVAGEYVPSQSVIWTIEGANSSNTTISDSGELKVGSDETASNLTVKATSVEDNTKSSTATVTIIRANIIQDAASNKITGIKEGDSYTVGTDITFDATGNSMDNTSPISGDRRYVPVSWSVNPNGTWTSAPYTATFKINNVGNYTLKVVYQEQTYNGTEWMDVASATDIKTVSFTVTSDNNDSNNNDNNNDDNNNNNNNNNDNNAIKPDNNSNKADDSLDDVPSTGEDNSIMWLFIAALMSGTAAVIMNSKKILLGKRK